jgi:hypothetical protein
VTDSSLGITASRAVPQGEAADTAQAVNLQDAIAVLRMVVGLDVNGAGRPLSPYQSFAADFNADGQVGLSDAIGMLRHVVGLDAPSPQWLLFNEADTTVAARAGLQPGHGAGRSACCCRATTPGMGLVGVLRGDVDGSFAGPPVPPTWTSCSPPTLPIWPPTSRSTPRSSASTAERPPFVRQKQPKNEVQPGVHPGTAPDRIAGQPQPN